MSSSGGVPRRILFVCLGNICRSPTAEGLLKKRLADQGVADSYRVTSAGVIARGDDVAALESINVAADHGVDLRRHLSTKLTGKLLRQQDLIIAMDRMIAERILELAPEMSDRVRLHLAYDASSSGELDVLDPIGQDMDVFRLSYEQVARGLAGLLAELGVSDGHSS